VLLRDRIEVERIVDRPVGRTGRIIVAYSTFGGDVKLARGIEDQRVYILGLQVGERKVRIEVEIENCRKVYD
jgi:hypothetical protein